MRQIQIKKRSLPEWSALILFLLPFVYSFLTEFLKLPNVIKFASDLLIIIPLFVVLYNSFSINRFHVKKINSWLIGVVVVFFLYVLIGYLLNYKSIFYLLWGVRNNFRFYFAFFVFLFFVVEEDAKKFLDVVDYLFWIHLAVTIIQYFVFGYEQDYLGGIFGVQKGCNGYVIAFICIVITRSLLLYMNSQEGTFYCFIKCGTALFLAALAELKVFLLFFLLIVVISVMTTDFSKKKLVLIVISIPMIALAYLFLVSLFDYFEGFLSIDYLLNELLRENYSSSEDLGRFTSVPTICERFLTTTFDRLVGMGIGNCDTSAISIFNTDFYDRYVDIHYSVFSISFIFLETGFIGLVLFISFFIVCLVQSIRALRQKRGNVLFNQMGIVMSILCFVLMFYNSSLRTEAGYMIYFVLALPFIGLNNSEHIHATAFDI